MSYTESIPLTGPDSEPLFKVKFHIEKVRLVAQGSFIALMIICGFITNNYIMGVRVDPETTVIYKLFGFNHACNYLDYNPAKLVAAIMIPLVSVPFMLYTFLFHLRLKRAHNNGVVTDGHLWFSRIITPFCIAIYSVLHLWFVNGPGGYYGFLGHYLPYVLCQIALFFNAVNQIIYLKETKNVPFGLSDAMANAYIIGLFVVMVFIQICGVSIAVGSPVLDTANNPGYARILQIGSNTFVIAVLGSIIFAYEESKNGDENIITFS